MTAHDIITELERLPADEQAKVPEYVVSHFPVNAGGEPQLRLNPRPFEAAMDRVFRENGELLRCLAQ